MSKIIKNTTISDISLKDAGITIPASSQYEIEPQDYLLWATDDVLTEISSYLTSGDLVVNDGINDLSATDGTYYLKYPDSAFNQRFLSEPDRSNGFTAKTVQEAIEESKANIEGKTTALPSFMNNGITKNKWLALDRSMSSSNELPAIIAYDSTIASIVFINKNDDSDVDIELYKNGILDFTWELRNKRWAYKTNGLTSINLVAGDKLSCFAREVTGGTGVDPTSVILDVVLRSTSSITGEGGSSTL